MTYGRMSQENEITALKSAGVNLFSIIKPALWFGSIVGFLLCLFNNFILPDMNYNARLLARDIYQKKPELTIEPGYFVDMIPQYTMIVKELEGNQFKDVKIFSKNTQSEQTTIYAETGSLESKDGVITVNLQNGEIHEIDLENYDHYRKIKFGTHQIIISMDDLLLNRTSESNRTDREMRVPAMIEKIQQNKVSIEQIKKRIEVVKNDLGIETNTDMSLANIIAEIELLKNDAAPNIEETRDYNNDIPVGEYEQKEKIRSLNNNARQFQNEFTLIENYEKNNNKFLVEIHKKFTLAVACILFTLVGAPLGILVKRGGITIASALSIAFFLIYYILLIWGEQLADRALLDPAVGSWMPNIILLIVGIIILFLSDKKN
jgi:lipopolysaccharide export system permease protein